jgi:hypothetical protein
MAEMAGDLTLNNFQVERCMKHNHSRGDEPPAARAGLQQPHATAAAVPAKKIATNTRGEISTAK